MLDRKFINDKLDLIKDYYRDLETVTSVPLETLKADRIRYYATGAHLSIDC